MQENRHRSGLTGLGAFFAMLLGGLVMIILVVNFNPGAEKKEQVRKKQTRIVKVKKERKPVPKKTQPKKKMQTKRKTAPKVQPPDLESIIGGLAMNIPEFAASEISTDSRELLEDIVKDTVMSEGSVDSKPQITYRAPITYPTAAVKKGIQGYVVVHLLIAEDGSVELSKVLESKPQGVFDNSVLSGIQDWRFTPAMYKGEPVKVWVKQKVSFNT